MDIGSPGLGEKLTGWDIGPQERVPSSKDRHFNNVLTASANVKTFCSFSVPTILSNRKGETF